MKLFLSILVAIGLVGCGGGGSSDTSQSTVALASAPLETFQAPAVLTNGKFRLAKIDYRFDTPESNKNSKGYHTTSYQVVNPMIDQIKKIGFSGVIFQLQTSVNKDTGQVSTTDQLPNIKTTPKDLWKVVDYAKSQGLQVWLSLQISDSVCDCNIIPDFNKYTEQSMFDSIVAFDKPIAKLAQQHNVDGIFISEGNYSLEDDVHLPYWRYLIAEIKSVYSGKLSYATHIIKPTAIWHYVDYPSVFMSGALSKTPIYDLKSIVNLYNDDINHINQVETLKRLYNIYGKKFILTLGATMADQGVGMMPDDFWSMTDTNTWVATTLPTHYTNDTIQLLKLKAFFEIVHWQLSDVTDGIAFIEFAPWLENVNFSDINNPVYKYYCCGWNLTNNVNAQKVLNMYLSKPWGYITL